MSDVGSSGVDGLVMVVSGGASGVGRATLQNWRRWGGTGVGLDIAGAGQPGVLYCDVTVESEVAGALDAVANEHGRLDALVHCAGVLGSSGSIVDLSVDDWRWILSVHATGGFLLAKHAVARMVRGGGGSIVFAGSIVAELGSAANPAYAAAKAALVNLGLSLAAGFGRQQVRTNVVNAGSTVGTGLLQSSRGFCLTPLELAFLAQSVPLGRAATAEDIAGVMCFLCSPAARHINGAVLTVDGGERLPFRAASTGPDLATREFTDGLRRAAR